MNKKGQIYLIISLLVGLVIFVLTSEPNTVNITPHDDDFKLISQNYNQESSKFLSSLIENSITTPSEIEKKFTEFSIVFTQYSKSQNPTFGLIYFLNYNNNLYVGNFLDKAITFQVNPTYTLSGCYGDISAVISYGDRGSVTEKIDAKVYSTKNCITTVTGLPDDKDSVVTLNLEGEEEIVYEVNIILGQPEVIIISRESEGEDRKVFVEKQFIKGKRDKNRGRGGNNQEDDDIEESTG